MIKKVFRRHAPDNTPRHHGLATALLILLGAPIFEAMAAPPYRYLPIGDSYTIGAGVPEEERWPNRLVTLLPQLQLIGNPAISGWTTEDVLQTELPVAQSAKPDLITLLIGTNDWVRGSSAEKFRANLSVLVAALQKTLSPRGAMVMVTVPNFDRGPATQQFTGGRVIRDGLKQFNAIINDEAKKRDIPVADIFELSEQAGKDPEMLAADGFHPSGKQYRLWAEAIAKVVGKTISAR